MDGRIIRPEDLVGKFIDVQMVTPEMRRARKLHEAQKRLLLDDTPPAPTRNVPQKPRRHARQQARPNLPPELYNGEVPRLYEGRTAVLFATGPSLTEEVVEMIEPFWKDETVVTFGCNDAFRIVPYLDISYACDPPWMKHAVQHYHWLDHPSVKWTQDKGGAQEHKLNWIGGISKPGLSTAQNLIHFGGNSGYQVLNLAVLYGCSRFILVGYNMSQVGGKRHFFGDHPQPMSRATSYPTFIQSFQSIRGPWRERIINCTPESKLEMFVKADLLETLTQCRDAMKRSPDTGPASQQSSSEPDPA